MVRLLLVLAIVANIYLAAAQSDSASTRCCENERYVDCPEYVCAVKDCSEVGYGLNCDYGLEQNATCPGRPGCICNEGYARNSDGVCIPVRDCPSCAGDENASYGCGNCRNLCSNYNTGPVFCPAICKLNDCTCNDGYVYDSNIRKCVLPEDCTPVCEENEIFSNCSNGGCFGARNCSEIGKPTVCVLLVDGACKPGCLCEDGFLRNASNVCVPEDQCTQTPTCGLNEVFSNCTNGGCYGARNCTEKGRPIRCVKLNPKDCKKGCLCKEGYLRNSKGVCIKEDKCPNTVTCGINEVFSNCANGGCFGPRRCSDTWTGILCVDLIEGGCRSGCLCKDGYKRNNNGECIPEDQCPNGNNTCKANEIYDLCPAKCPPRTCGIDDRLVDCAPGPQVGDPDCPAPACRCDNGFYRNDKGECVVFEDCPTCSNPNEVYDPCPAPCPPRRCDVDERVIRCAAPPQLGDPECQPGCRCEDGYKRNSKGICVPRDQCESIICNRPNEVYNECPVTCPPQTCESIGQKYNCPLRPLGEDALYCKPACSCQPGFYRNKVGECISEENCLRCTGPNEYYSCGGACDNVCATLSQQNQTNCPILNVKCNEWCYCEDGYARNANGICVPYAQCEPPCANGGQYNKCPIRACDADYCPESRHSPQFCASDKKCHEPRCTCPYNKKLDRKTKKCIDIKDCPPFKCVGKNEEYQACPPRCPGENCSDYLKNETCSQIGRIGIPLLCQPQCRCKRGFYRNSKGECVLAKQCRPATICGKNEIFSNCTQAVCRAQTCDEAGDQISCAAVVVDVDSCKKGCICKENFVRDSNNNCIPVEECPPEQCPGPNEFYDTCPPSCSPQTCESIGQIIECPPSITLCQPACRCLEGYYRNNGTCVPEAECPKPGDECNGPNEFYDFCPPSCSPQTCDSIGQTFECPPSITLCRPACRCQEGFYRNNGTCVAEEDCPTKPCANGGVFNTCPAAPCDADYCPKSRNSPQACRSTRNCGEPRCTCSFNQKLDRTTKKCINIRDCPPFKCRNNEEYQACPPLCPGENCTDYLNNATCPRFGRIGIVLPCNPQCRCKKGFYRNSNGNCVSARRCECDAASTTTTTTSPPTADNSNAQQLFSEGISTFTTKFLNILLQTQSGVNLITSPSSVGVPLAELALYANGNSLNQLLTALNLQNKDQIRSVFKAFITEVKSVTDVIFKLAAKVYANQIYPLSSAFLTDTREVFEAEAENIDCSKPVETSNTINQWVEQNTNNRIEKLVTPSMITEDTRLVLVNGIYFKGIWKYQFNPNDTQDSDFNVDKENTVKTPMMYQKNEFRYAESAELEARVLEMPYKNEYFRWLIVLPNTIDGLKNTVSKLNSSTLQNARDSLSSRQVQLTMPRMKISTTIPLAEILQALNIKNIFDTNKANLTGISKTNEPVSVTDFVQKAYIEVNEEGAEAAAANAVLVSTLSAVVNPEDVIFNADHPFTYFIYYKDIPVFCGIYQKP